MSDQPEMWEVIAAINGNCVYSKQNVSQQDASEFVCGANKIDGTARWTWPDGEMFFAQAGTCAMWARRMG